MQPVLKDHILFAFSLGLAFIEIKQICLMLISLSAQSAIKTEKRRKYLILRGKRKQKDKKEKRENYAHAWHAALEYKKNF